MADYLPVKDPKRPALARFVQAAIDGVRRRAPWLLDMFGPIKRWLSRRYYAWMARRDRRAIQAHRRDVEARRRRLTREAGLEGDSDAAYPLLGETGLVHTILRKRSVVAGDGVLHCIGSLGPGGAERQLCLLMAGARRAGVRTSLLTLRPLAGDDAHYAKLARASADRLIDVRKGRAAARRFKSDAATMLLADRLPDCYRDDVTISAAVCRRERPEVLHAWLDSNNVGGGIGALLAGVPRVVLGLRNVSPVHFPHLLLPEMRGLYVELSRFDRVHFVANTIEGARDYAGWIGIDPARIAVVANAVDFPSIERSAQEQPRAAMRQALGISPGAPLLLGVFRLSDEKRPFVWIEIVERVLESRPEVQAIHIGVGTMEPEFRARIAQSPHRGRLHHLSRRDDVHAVMAAADVILLASRAEGMPNVLLEAQALGCVPVATVVGGTPEVIESGVTGELRELDDIAGLAAATTALLSDPARRKQMADTARVRVRERFSIDALVKATRRIWGL